QIAPTSGQEHSGQNSLVIIFNTSNAKDFRSVSQTVAVEPRQKYQFQLFYRSDLKTDAVFKFQIVDAVDNTVVVETTPLTATAEWQERTVTFNAPTPVDGVIVRLDRQNCGNVVCQVTGNLWIDDVSLKPIN
ncbi:MAG: carbohydrate binding domain-containing protein, partial [Acidobacteriota bacterium]